jgi:hypothetical protein
MFSRGMYKDRLLRHLSRHGANHNRIVAMMKDTNISRISERNMV